VTQPFKLDERLKAFATERQVEYIDAINLHGGASAAGRALGVNKSCIARAVNAVLKRAAREGFAPGHFEHGVAPGFAMGKVTVQRAADGSVERTWERQSPDRAAVWDAMLAHVEAAKEEIGPVAPLAPPGHCDEDLLTIYPQGDPHAGLYAWEAETGARFDLAEFERINRAAIDRLVQSTPHSAIAIYNDKGDSTHADNSKNRTPQSGNELDVHGRHAEVVRVSLRVKRYHIARLLEKHRLVIVRIDPGNHDMETALHQALVLEALYENEPRVEVITSPNPYWYYQFGSNLLGTCHGDGAKGRDLPLLMATDQPAWWGETEFRLWLAGHVHHEELIEYNGARVEYIGTLAANDAHHHRKGFRSKRNLKAITLHRTDGEVERHTCSLKRVERLAA
jgi:hypothetical protein